MGVAFHRLALCALYRYKDAMPKRKSRPNKAAGRIYNLRSIFRRLNGLYFQGSVKASIEWGRGRGLRARRSREFGTYYYDDKLIRIHPVLDQAWVPLCAVESVMFHEMCHQVCPERIIKGRRIAHNREFRAMERRYTQHREAAVWFDANLKKLFQAAPTLEPPVRITPAKQLRLAFAA